GVDIEIARLDPVAERPNSEPLGVILPVTQCGQPSTIGRQLVYNATATVKGLALVLQHNVHDVDVAAVIPRGCTIADLQVLDSVHVGGCPQRKDDRRPKVVARPDMESRALDRCDPARAECNAVERDPAG